jgi:probable F420-dependent oxidoreductase
MRIGAVLPTTEIGNNTDDVTRWSRDVESAGYESLMAYDHVVGAVHSGRSRSIDRDYDETTPFREPLTLFAYLAGVTSTVELISGVLVLPQRQAVLVAKQAAEVSLLSGGRFTLGAGIGWNWIEYEALGADFHRRGRILDEQLAVMRALWSGDVVDFKGRYHRIDRAALMPRPRAPIPILLGGSSGTAIDRAARTADGFIVPSPTAMALDLHTTLINALSEQRGDAEDFRVVLQVHAAAGIDHVKSALSAWTTRRVDDVVVSTMRNRLIGATEVSCDSVDAHLDLLHLAREAVIDVMGDPKLVRVHG